ncbi:hypothetical protein GC177_01985 [bacterium]|nr:hypothetical protein [bacterium]
MATDQHILEAITAFKKSAERLGAKEGVDAFDALMMAADSVVEDWVVTSPDGYDDDEEIEDDEDLMVEDESSPVPEDIAENEDLNALLESAEKASNAVVHLMQAEALLSAASPVDLPALRQDLLDIGTFLSRNLYEIYQKLQNSLLDEVSLLQAGSRINLDIIMFKESGHMPKNLHGDAAEIAAFDLLEKMDQEAREHGLLDESAEATETGWDFQTPQLVTDLKPVQKSLTADLDELRLWLDVVESFNTHIAPILAETYRG